MQQRNSLEEGIVPWGQQTLLARSRESQGFWKPCSLKQGSPRPTVCCAQNLSLQLGMGRSLFPAASVLG